MLWLMCTPSDRLHLPLPGSSSSFICFLSPIYYISYQNKLEFIVWVQRRVMSLSMVSIIGSFQPFIWVCIIVTPTWSSCAKASHTSFVPLVFSSRASPHLPHNTVISLRWGSPTSNRHSWRLLVNAPHFGSRFVCALSSNDDILNTLFIGTTLGLEEP